MKHTTLKLVSLLLLAACFGFLTACEEEDPVYPVTIVVKYEGDTLKTVPGAIVTIYQVIEDNGQKVPVNLQGGTDLNGQCHFELNYEAIHDVDATIDTGGGPDHLFGETTVRLKKDETIFRTIFVAKI